MKNTSRAESLSCITPLSFLPWTWMSNRSRTSSRSRALVIFYNFDTFVGKTKKWTYLKWKCGQSCYRLVDGNSWYWGHSLIQLLFRYFSDARASYVDIEVENSLGRLLTGSKSACLYAVSNCDAQTSRSQQVTVGASISLHRNKAEASGFGTGKTMWTDA